MLLKSCSRSLGIAQRRCAFDCTNITSNRFFNATFYQRSSSLSRVVSLSKSSFCLKSSSIPSISFRLSTLSSSVRPFSASIFAQIINDSTEPQTAAATTIEKLKNASNILKKEDKDIQELNNVISFSRKKKSSTFVSILHRDGNKKLEALYYNDNNRIPSTTNGNGCNVFVSLYSSRVGNFNRSSNNRRKIQSRMLTISSKNGFHKRRHISTTNKKHWKTIPKKLKGVVLSDEFMSALGIGVVFSTIYFFPTIVNSMKSSTNQYNETDVEDDLMYHQMNSLSKDLSYEIAKFLNIRNTSDAGDDRRTIGNTTEIFSDVLNSEALQNAIASLVARVIGSEQFKKACQKVIKTLWDDLIHDPETTAQVVQLLNTALQNEQIKRSFKELIMGLLKDGEINKELTQMVVRLGEENEVLNTTRDLLTESAHRALNDPEILDHSMEFATDVVGDDIVQRTSGEALRNTVTYAVRPSLSTFLSIFGIGLLIFSASALGNARSSAREGREIDAAASKVVQNAGSIISRALSKILVIPGRAIRQLVEIPSKLMGKVAMSIVKGGRATGTIISDLILRIIKSASYPFEVLLNTILIQSRSSAEAVNFLFLKVGFIIHSATYAATFILRIPVRLVNEINMNFPRLKRVCSGVISGLKAVFTFITGFG